MSAEWWVALGAAVVVVVILAAVVLVVRARQPQPAGSAPAPAADPLAPPPAPLPPPVIPLPGTAQASTPLAAPKPAVPSGPRAAPEANSEGVLLWNLVDAELNGAADDQAATSLEPTRWAEGDWLSPERTRTALSLGHNGAVALRSVLHDLQDQVEGLAGCVLVSPEGLVVVSTLPPEEDVGPLAALAASVLNRAERLAEAAHHGAMHQGLFDTDRGLILVAHSGPFLLVAVAESRVNLGMLRMQLPTAARRLAEAVS